MKKIHAAVLAAAIALMAGLLLARHLDSAVPTASWGLHFETEGQPPSGPLSTEKLAQYDAACLDPDGGKVLYLTFDAGYENGCTAEILDILQKQEVPACFFLVGNYLERNADLVRRMVSEGHTVGNHTMDHPDMSALDSAAFAAQLQDLEALYTGITGQEMAKFYRPPQGIYSEDNLRQAKELGYRTVFWSLAYADWDNDNQPSPEAAMEKLTARVHDGAVILLHSTSRTNAQILDRLLTEWKSMGYRFAPVSELFQSY